MNLRSLAIWGAIVLVLVAVFGVMNSGPHGPSKGVTYSEMLTRVDSGEIKSVKIKGQTVEAHDRTGQTLTATGPLDTSDLQRRLEAHGAAFDFEQPGAGPDPDHPRQPAADRAADRGVGLLHAPDAGRRARRHGLRQVQGQDAHREQEPRDLRRRRRRGRGQGRPGRDRRLPQGPGQVPEAGRQDPARAR